MNPTGAVVQHPRARIAQILAVLAVLASLAPLSMDIYIPSLPEMQRELGGAPWVVQSSVTACLLGIGVGQLLWGPLSDRRGRRPVVLLGVIGWTITSVLSAVAVDAVMLIVVRGVAGLCGAAGIVVGRSIVRDLSPDVRTVSSRIGTLAMVTAVAPVVAPLIGALIASAFGWRADFVALAALGGVLALAFALVVPESLPAEQRVTGGGFGVIGALGRALQDRELAWVAAAIAAHAFGFYAYITTASFIVEEQFGYPPLVFALVFGTNALAMFTANLVFRRLVRRWHHRHDARSGDRRELRARLPGLHTRPAPPPHPRRRLTKFTPTTRPPRREASVVVRLQWAATASALGHCPAALTDRRAVSEVDATMG